MTKKDYVLAVIAGFITVIFLFPVFKNISISLPFGLHYSVFFVVIPAFWVFLIFISSFLQKKISFVGQIVKFLITGFLNTAIDFGILNFLSIELGVYSGLKILGINPISFIVAAINSFFWNKYWTFGKMEKPEVKEILGFIAVAITAVIINTGILLLFSKILTNYFSLSDGRILNLAKVLATAISLFWNFIGMKIFVFNSKRQ